MNRTQIEKMLEKYKGVFYMRHHNAFALVDANGDTPIYCQNEDDAELVVEALNFMADSFSIIKEN